MTNIDAIQSAMNEIAVVELINGEIHITTHCLYPSNSAVSVIVRGSGNAFVVTDDGGAIGEVGSTGMREGPNDRQIRALVKAHGLEVKGGVIYAPPVKFDEISAAVLLVANASKEVADWCLSHLRFTQPRNFRRDLSTPSLRRNPMPDIEAICAKLDAIGEAEMYEAPASTKAATDEAASLIRQQAAEIERLRETVMKFWHESSDIERGQLHDCLGMTWDQYAAWVKQ